MHPLLAELYEAERARLDPAVTWVDAHTHIGQRDPDGMTGTLEELLADLGAAGHERALVFPMHEPGGYPGPNAEVREEAARADGRLRTLTRVDPNAPEAMEDARRGLQEGAAGFKLHPRSDAFGLPHPVVDELAELADEAGAVILIHAGRGIPHLGVSATDMTRRHPRMRLILAHAGISDLGWIAPAAAELPNLLFDTAWWQVSDMLSLFAFVPPGNIVYGSDTPYARSTTMAWVALRSARAAGLGPDVVGEIAGGQLARVLAGEPPADLGPAPGAPHGARRLDAERALAYAGAATQLAFRGYDATEPMALARLACVAPEGRDDPVLEVVDELLAHAQQAREQATEDEPRAGVELLMAAQILAGTAGCGL
jgi:hypothetical protein